MCSYVKWFCGLVLMGFFWATGWHRGAEPAPLSTARALEEHWNIPARGSAPAISAAQAPPSQPWEGNSPLANSTWHLRVHPPLTWPAHPHCRRHPQSLAQTFHFCTFTQNLSEQTTRAKTCPSSAEHSALPASEIIYHIPCVKKVNFKL